LLNGEGYRIVCGNTGKPRKLEEVKKGEVEEGEGMTRKKV